MLILYYTNHTSVIWGNLQEIQPHAQLLESLFFQYRTWENCAVLLIEHSSGWKQNNEGGFYSWFNFY